MPFKGYDAFHPNPGEYDKMHCLVCDAEMNVRRNCNGPTGMIEAMGGFKRLHDSFICPHTDEDWHKQALNLTREAEKTCSQKLTNLLLLERSEVIKSKKVSKDGTSFFNH